jgi:N6-adenosine-specific RNA methylase IME4
MRAHRLRKGKTINRKRRRARKDANVAAVKQERRQQHAVRVAKVQRQAEADAAAVEITLPALIGIRIAFPLVLIDDPLRFITRSEKGEGRAPPYPTLIVPELSRFVPPMARRALMVAWVQPNQDWAAHLLAEARGFKVRDGCRPTTKSYWVKKEHPDSKPVRGKGYWVRIDPEEEIWYLSRGGFPAPIPGENIPQTFYHAVLRKADGSIDHSRKPWFVHEHLERLYPGLEKLEMFARPPFRRGWHVWGNEVPGGYLTPEQAEALGLVEV